MKATMIRLFILCLGLMSPATARAQVITQLDSYWAEVTRTVREGDFEGYGALYHPDAVLVNLGSRSSYPIEQALAGWEQGFVDTSEGRAEANVEFRFSQRLNDGATAHETGIFRYTLKQENGSETVGIVHFEGLLVRKDGRWVMLMEYQKQPATDAEWNAAN